jgi:hypothetical protein
VDCINEKREVLNILRINMAEGKDQGWQKLGGGGGASSERVQSSCMRMMDKGSKDRVVAAAGTHQL